MLTFDKDNPSPGEGVRENYRRQGRKQERNRIKQLLEGLLEHRADATWSPVYIINLIMKDADEA